MMTKCLQRRAEPSIFRAAFLDQMSLLPRANLKDGSAVRFHTRADTASSLTPVSINGWSLVGLLGLCYFLCRQARFDGGTCTLVVATS